MPGTAAAVVARASSARKKNILGVSDAAKTDAGEVSPTTLQDGEALGPADFEDFRI